MRAGFFISMRAGCLILTLLFIMAYVISVSHERGAREGAELTPTEPPQKDTMILLGDSTIITEDRKIEPLN